MMADSVSYCFQCFVLSLLSVSYALIAVMGFILSWLLVFYTVSALSISRYHGCQGFILLVLLVFHVIMDVSFHTVMYSGSGRICGLKTAFSQRITK